MELLITFLAGVSILVGALLTHILDDTERVEHASIALALGALLSLFFFDLGPDVLEYIKNGGRMYAFLFMAGGFVLLVLLDRLVPDHEDTEATHDHENAAHIGLIASLGIILHNIVEGMTVYSLGLVSIENGIVFAIGIALHNIPMGMMIDSTLQEHSRARRWSVLAAVTLSTLAGGILVRAFESKITEFVTGSLVAAASGMILYLVLVELLPHVFRNKKKLPSFLFVAAGFVLVYLSCKIG